MTKTSCVLEESKFHFFQCFNPEFECVSVKHSRPSKISKLMQDPDWDIEHDVPVDVSDIFDIEEDQLSIEENFDFIREDVLQLSELLKTTPEETLFFIATYSVQLSQGCVDNQSIASFFDINKIEFLRLLAIKESLVKKGHLRLKESRACKDGFFVCTTAERCILENKPFKKQKSVQTDRYKFCRRITNLIEERDDENIVTPELFMMVEEEEVQYRQLKFIQALKKMVQNVEDRTIFYNICDGYVNSRNRQVLVDAMLSHIYDGNRQRFAVAKSMIDTKHILIQENLVEMLPAHFISDAETTLSEKGKRLFLEEDYELFCNESIKNTRLIRPENIPERRLFFNEQLEKDLNFLKDCLMEERFQELQNDLKDNGMSTGINILLYGLPGTDKTASAEMIAKATGRSVYHVDIAASKSCWFGQSEKLFKKIFEDYESMSKSEKLKPILLFNEADALFGKRKNVDTGNLTQTENALQNILLEQMEKMDGILIATTNLCDNLDSACDLREGQVFVSKNAQRPEHFCESAWGSVKEFVEVLANGGGNFYDGWMKNPYSAMISCNDGFRPVSFLLEAEHH
ncbi:MAG: TIGR04076 family protein [Bacteroidales bacterium]|nr:TIGR04076 family protein [Bacteroidales bacterium]